MNEFLVAVACGFLGYTCGIILALGCWYAATNINTCRHQ